MVPLSLPPTSSYPAQLCALKSTDLPLWKQESWSLWLFYWTTYPSAAFLVPGSLIFLSLTFCQQERSSDKNKKNFPNAGSNMDFPHYTKWTFLMSRGNKKGWARTQFFRDKFLPQPKWWGMSSTKKNWMPLWGSGCYTAASLDVKVSCGPKCRFHDIQHFTPVNRKTVWNLTRGCGPYESTGNINPSQPL